jgi:tripartite-type tricarboxylate transporter receptor subunit TctC
MVDLERSASCLSILSNRLALSVAIAVISTSAAIAADAYPVKSVRIVVPSGAGSGDDFVTRMVVPTLGVVFGQPFVVDNRPGAAGMIGQTFVAKAPPDGYTLLYGGGSMAGARYANAAVTYDVLRDFTPISQLTATPFVLLVHPSVPARNVKDYIALARSRPDKMTFATTGAGQSSYWCAMLFNSMARIDTVEIPYKTGPGALVDMIAGQVDYFFGGANYALSNSEKLRALAVTSSKRSSMLPNVPTMSEAALPGYDYTWWAGMVGPGGMGSDIVTALNKALGRALTAPDVRDRLLKAGYEPTPSSPEELRKRYADWVVKFGKIAKDAGLQPH